MKRIKSQKNTYVISFTLNSKRGKTSFHRDTNRDHQKLTGRKKEMLESGKGRCCNQEEHRELLNVSLLNLGGEDKPVSCYSLNCTHMLYMLFI